MIHIFDKLYITYAETSVGPDSLERMSEDYIQIIDKSLFNIEHKTYEKKRLFYKKSVDELLESFGDGNNLFDFIDKVLKNSATNKVIIYADEKSLNEFIIRWWKAIFPNLSLNGLYSLYSSYADSETLQMSKSASYINIAVDSSNIPFRYFSKIYWDKSINEIDGLNQLYPAFDVPSSIKKKVSIEFKLINYLIDLNSPQREEQVDNSLLLLNISNLYKKAFMYEVCGIKRMVERSLPLLSKHFLPDNKKYKLSPKSLVDEIKSSEALSFILDEKIKESKESFSYLSKNYDLPVFCKMLIELDFEIHSQLKISKASLFQDNPCLASFLEKNEHPDLEKLIVSECDGTSIHHIFKKMIQKNKVNPYILPGFYNLLCSDIPADKNLAMEFKIV